MWSVDILTIQGTRGGARRGTGRHSVTNHTPVTFSVNCLVLLNV